MVQADESFKPIPYILSQYTGEPLGMSRRMAAADNTIYHDARHPSQVILPIVEKGGNAG